MKNLPFLSALLFTTILLTGCVNVVAPYTSDTAFTAQSPKARSEQLQKISHWKINGAFSIQYNNKGDLANFTWSQNNNRYHIQISSPLNVYTVEITGVPGAVHLKESKHPPLHANSAEALLKKRLGWNIPISNLKYWIRGLPNPTISNTPAYDKLGLLNTLTQQGWSVKFSHYTHVASYDLPTLLQVTGHGLTLKLVIKNWAI